MLERNSSDLVRQDFRSLDFIGRAKRNAGPLIFGMLATDQRIAAGGNNLVIGPDVQWRRSDRDLVSAQLVFSRSRTPQRTDLASDWDGRSLASTAADLRWEHSTPSWDWFTQYNDIGRDFRADLGFLPQIDYRETYNNVGYTIRPDASLMNNIRFYVTSDYQARHDDQLLYRMHSIGADMHGRWNSYVRVRFGMSRILAGQSEINRNQLMFIAQATPSKRVTLAGVDGSIGQQIDFVNARRGSGLTVRYYATLHPSDRIEVAIDNNLQFIDRPQRGRVFTDQSERLRIAAQFSVASAVRLVVQNVHTNRNTSLYEAGAAPRSGSVAASLLYVYTINYATGIYLGAGDSRIIDEATTTFSRPARSLFFKLSYALQR